MKLRLDLLAKLTPEMVMEGIVANNHRYNPEPLLSKTGTGSLSSASTEERAKEERLSAEIIRRIKEEHGNYGNRSDNKS